MTIKKMKQVEIKIDNANKKKDFSKFLMNYNIGQ